jgi:uncharacterized membrane protein YcjF (UPF0283 family)
VTDSPIGMDRAISGIAKVLVAFGGALFGLAVVVMLVAIFASGKQTHGGAYLFVGAAMLLVPAFVSAVIGYAIHRRRQSRRPPAP